MEQISYYKMNMIELFDRSFDMYKRTFLKSMAYLILIHIIISVAMMGVLIVTGIPTVVVFTVIEEFFSETALSLFSIFLLIVSAIIMLIVFVSIYTAGTFGVVYIAQDDFTGKKIDIFKVFERVLQKLFKMMITTAAGAIVIFPGYILLAIDTAYIIYFGFIQEFELGTFNLNIVNWIGVILLSLITIGYFIYFSIIYQFVVPVVMIEGIYGFKAFKRSKMLVKENFWKLFGVNFMWSIVVASVQYSFNGILVIIGITLFFVFRMWEMPFEKWIESTAIIFGTAANVVELLVGLLFAPLSGFFLALLYFNQRFKKEALDLHWELEKIKDVTRNDSVVSSAAN